jgi:hypothetical protein
MKRFSIILFSIVAIHLASAAQTFTDSNLPIVIITTDFNKLIPDNPRVLATMKIIYRGEGARNYVTDKDYPAYLNYNGRIDIETRGSSSQTFDKKQYGFSTLKADNVSNNNVSLLGMPAENDWILNCMVFDSTFIRDYLNFNLSRQLGEYASRTEYCELMINGSYRGLYLLEEKIKGDDNRVDITELSITDNYLPEVSGGYITKADKRTAEVLPPAFVIPSSVGWNVEYFHHEPDPDEITSKQNAYIYNHFSKLATAAKNNNTSLTNGFPSLIDMPSFIHFIIISELGSNPDAYQLSTFFHKDRNGKLRAGPIWDSDLTYGNDLFLWGYDRSHPDVWQFADGGNDGSAFWYDLFNNSLFRCYLAKRWNELIQPGQPLNPESLESFIDQTVVKISEALGRENTRWGDAAEHAQNIADMKSWINTRVAWITANLGSYSACSNPDLPSLVITKINFNPQHTVYYPDDQRLEFIEILNNDDQPVNMTGFYFGGTGLVYQFPYNSNLEPGASIYLASDAGLFLSRYGSEPFGDYTRKLSDKSQNLLLCDGYGNIIDNVHYQDTIPWPEADGNGYYLKLTDPGLDNNVPESWVASKDIILSDFAPETGKIMEMSPNPVKEILTISSSGKIGRIGIYDLMGRLIDTRIINDESCELDMKSYNQGIYIIKADISGITYTGKVIRE